MMKFKTVVLCLKLISFNRGQLEISEGAITKQGAITE